MLRRTLIAIGALIAFARPVRADQCMCLTPAQQQAALAHLAPGTNILQHCEACALEPPVPITVATVEPVTIGPGCTVLAVNGQSGPQLDLAYTFVQLDADVDLYTNLAKLGSCPHQRVSDSVRRDGARPIPAERGTSAQPAMPATVAASPRRFADANLDGRIELCHVASSTLVECRVPGTSRVVAARVTQMGNPAEQTWVDQNGDGRIDFCRITDGAPRCELAGTGTTFDAQSLGPPSPPATIPMRGFADVNGDRRADDCRIVGAELFARIDCTLAMPGGGFGIDKVSASIAARTGDDGWPRWMADVDGDGKAEFCRISWGEVVCKQIDPDGMDLRLGIAFPSLQGARDPTAVDVNGDRAADLCAVTAATRTPFCILGGASSGALVELAPLAVEGPYAWGDVDKDGDADVCPIVAGQPATCSLGRFSRWRTGEPDNTGHCARVITASGTWADADCRLPHRFVCGHVSDPTRWRVTDREGPWDAGDRACLAELGEAWRFTAPDSLDEAQALDLNLAQQSGVADAWINMTDRTAEGIWRRVDVFRAWSAGEPAAGWLARLCALSLSAGWRAEICGASARFACRSLTAPYTWKVTTAADRWIRGFRLCSDELDTATTRYRFAAPRTDADHKAIRAAAGSAKVWIDLTRFDDGYWDEIDPIYDNFTGAEPDDHQGSEGCVAVLTGGLWADRGCDLRYPVACRTGDPAAPRWSIAAASDWNGAGNACRAAGGWFDAPAGKADNVALAAVVGAAPAVWINRTNRDTVGGAELHKRCIWDLCAAEAVIGAVVITGAIVAAFYNRLQPAGHSGMPHLPVPPTCPDYGGADALATVDLLVVVTSASAAEMVNRGLDVHQVVNDRVQAFNRALRDSQIKREVRLVGIEIQDWDTVRYGTDVETLLKVANGSWDPTQRDPQTDNIRKLRTRYGADLISIFMPQGLTYNNSAVCGLGDDTLGQPGNARVGFSIIKGLCDGAQNSGFVHELGHNFGLKHDRYTVARAMTPPGSPDALPGYAYGWADLTSKVHTVMAYPTIFRDNGVTNQLRIDRFSSPCISDPSTGVALGDARTDARRALLENWGQVSRYRAPAIKDEL